MTLEDYTYLNKICVKIMSANDDKDNFFVTHIDVYSTYKLKQLSARNSFWKPTLTCYISRTRKKGDPLVLGISETLQQYFGWGSKRHSASPVEFKMALVFPNCGNATILIEKKNPYYHIMSQRLTKNNTMVTVSRAIYKSCFVDDPIKLMDYVFQMIVLPENIKYALENRTPYFFIDIIARERLEVRLNTKMISDDECALEISDGVWAPISVKDLDIFINFFYHGHTRTKKWMHMSPARLWETLLGTKPTTSQALLMVEFLTQNRTQDLIEFRAEQLMNSLVEKYPERIKLISFNTDKGKKATAMVVRGKLCDWIIIDSEFKTQIQKVKTFVYISDEALEDNKRQPFGYTNSGNHRLSNSEGYSGMLRGPICIDNIHTNSSLGDQYVARALALLNDKTTIELVNTIRRYIPKIILDGMMESRLDYDGLTAKDLQELKLT